MNRTDTTLIEFPWSLPEVTTTYRTPRARLRRAYRRFLASGFVSDVRGRLWIIPTAIGALTLAYLFLLLGQALHVLAGGVS